MNDIDKQFLKTPYYGVQQMVYHSWQLSNTMQNKFCIDTLNNALNQYGTPEIFNTDQSSQFTSNEFTQLLLSKDIKVSMGNTPILSSI